MLRNVRDIKQTVCTPKIPISRHQSRGIIIYSKRFNFNKNSRFNPIRRSSNWLNDKFPTCSDFLRSCVAAKNFSACFICCFMTLECFLFRLPAGTFNRPADWVGSVSTPRAVSSLSKLSSPSSCVAPSANQFLFNVKLRTFFLNVNHKTIRMKKKRLNLKWTEKKWCQKEPKL